MKYTQICLSFHILTQNLMVSRKAHCMYMIIYTLSNKRRFERIEYLIKWIYKTRVLILE